MISEFVEYVKQVWKNKPNISSPLNADRLNHMEAGIENNSKKIKETVTAVNELTEKIIYRDISFTGSVAGNDDKGLVCDIPADYNPLSVVCISDTNMELSNNGFLTSPIKRNSTVVCRWKNLVSDEVNFSATIRFYFISNT